MNMKRYLLACLAVYIAYQIMSFLVHGLWLMPMYEANASAFRPQETIESMQWIFLVTSAVWTLIFVYIFVKGYEGRGILEGIRYGALMGVLTWILQAYDDYAVYPIPYQLALYWFIAGVVSVIIFGVVAALVYRN